MALGVPFKNLVKKSVKVRIGGRLKMSPNGSPKAHFEHLLPHDRRECLATAGSPVHSKCLVGWNGVVSEGLPCVMPEALLLRMVSLRRFWMMLPFCVFRLLG